MHTLAVSRLPPGLADEVTPRLCAAGRDSLGRVRSPASVAWSVQRYLMFAILSCVPDRQRTLRELEVGRSLVKEKGR